MDSCDACGYDYHDLAREALGASLLTAARGVVDTLGAVGELRQRPAPEVWSALEYGCHVRDVLEVQQERLALAQAEDTPAFEPMGREERVTDLAYNDQDPADVASAIIDNARSLAEAVDTLTPEAWRRTGVYNWPEPTERTVEWIVRHTIHELVHHRGDIRAVGAGRIP